MNYLQYIFNHIPLSAFSQKAFQVSSTLKIADPFLGEL